MQILVEGKHGHGAIRTPYTRVRAKIRRTFRPKLGQATTPFNWNTDPQIIKARLDSIGIIKTKNQFQAYECGGCLGGYWLGIVKAVLGKSPYQDISEKSIYAPIAFPGGGTTVIALEKQICNAGGNTNQQVPSLRPDGTTDEIWATDKTWMTPSSLILASANAGWIAVSVNIDIDSMAKAILDNIATGWKIEGQNNGTWLSPNPMPPTSYSGIWAHFMCQPLVSLVNGEKTINSLQSWGTEVGNQGWQNFTSKYIDSGRITDVFTFVPKMVPHPTIPGQLIPNPNIITWQQRLVNYFLSIFK